jgi:hypothetical protein
MSAFPPEQNGLTARTPTPASIKYRANKPVNTVFPTPVSVPTTKNTCLLIIAEMEFDSLFYKDVFRSPAN